VVTIEPAKRRTADERRTDVIAAAIIEFATYGLHGASTEAIAARAGISQPYVLRLFGTKKALFLAAVTEVSEQIQALWERALLLVDPNLPPDERLYAIGSFYDEQTRDVHGMRLLLQSWAAAEDPDVRRLAHECMREMHAWVTRNVPASSTAVQRWFAFGMLLTVGASLGATEVAGTDEWARVFVNLPNE